MLQDKNVGFVIAIGGGVQLSRKLMTRPRFVAMGHWPLPTHGIFTHQAVVLYCFDIFNLVPQLNVWGVVVMGY